MRRITIVMALLLVASAPAAAAQAPRAAVGGGSFNDAPVLEPGRYRDSVLPGELLFYAVHVQPGQSLAAGAELQEEEGDDLFRLSGLDLFRVQVHSPLRELDPLDTAFQVRGGEPPRIEVGPAETISGAAGELRFRGPGTWYVAINAEPKDNAAPERVELPFTLEVAVTGTPAPEPRRSPPPVPTPDAGTGGGGADGDGPGLAAIVAVGGGGLLLGAVLAVALMRPRRRPT